MTDEMRDGGEQRDDVLNVDVLRKIALVYPLATKLDSLAALQPVPRVMLVAKVLQEACAESQEVERIVRESQFMSVLREEALLRQGGERPAMKPLVSPWLVVDRYEPQGA